MADVRLMQIDIIQPGDITSRVFDFWMNAELPDQTSSSMSRIEDPQNDHIPGVMVSGDWQIRFHVQNENGLNDADFAAKILGDIKDQARVFEVANDVQVQVRDLVVTPVPNEDWLAACFRAFAPFSVGRFFLHGTHDADAPVPDGQIGILIDAVTAFGSGEHPTTRGCLIALDRLAQSGLRPTRILDLGTGSGILAIAAKKLWPEAFVLAVDNDAESVKVAAEYADVNKVEMTSLWADTPAAADVAGAGPYDLVIANILAGPLRELAPAIVAVCTPDAQVILSGLLERQIDDVMASYTPLGMTIQSRTIIDVWAALVLQR